MTSTPHTADDATAFKRKRILARSLSKFCQDLCHKVPNIQKAEVRIRQKGGLSGNEVYVISDSTLLHDPTYSLHLIYDQEGRLIKYRLEGILVQQEDALRADVITSIPGMRRESALKLRAIFKNGPNLPSIAPP